MEYSPPILFKQGPSALARLLIFVSLALALLVADARFQAFEAVRKVIDTGLYPIQCAALVPRDLIVSGTNLFVTVRSLRNENKMLRDKNLQLSVLTSQAAQLLTENEHLRELLRLKRNSTIQTTPTEIRYNTRDPFTQKVIISAGKQQNVQAGAPVVNEKGIIGQITRVFPLQSEVTLLTDKDQAVPVQILRTGIYSVIYGSPKGDVLDLRFVPTSADVKIGDELVTNGLDGIYPPGLPVAKVILVDKKADTTFARVVCNPITSVRSTHQLLVLRYDADRRLSRPIDMTNNKPTDKAKDKKSKDSKESADSHTTKSATTSAQTILAGAVGA
ncbi:rod shape-determining protein MreC [Candidatus Vallotiella sp. (ex Adelges kitamiensis)]|uniref:rod shape-determining protein MreC n=1 Tax=Candidatus Vallotiella sp. (ex Adelges kitamiensis) TaxID=2864217 RepID=UPI001CE2411C|nr:rod shape-determining protein MreC [Candidatus Vallotia sp. (ex Adelges kitamiensis)]